MTRADDALDLAKRLVNENTHTISVIGARAIALTRFLDAVLPYLTTSRSVMTSNSFRQGMVVGGLLGNQVGSGRGRTATTIVGALGGALAGNGIERAVHRRTTYQGRVQMSNDRYRSFSFENPPDIHAGESVRVRDGVLVAE